MSQDLRPRIGVDEMPNAGWDQARLIEIGLAHGVDFGTTPREQLLNMRPEQLLEVLYEQVCFEDNQDRVEEVRGRRAYINQAKEEPYRHVVKLTYTGFSLLMLPLRGRIMYFHPGQSFILDEGMEEAVDFFKLRPQKDFRVDRDVIPADAPPAEAAFVKFFRDLEGDDFDYDDEPGSGWGVTHIDLNTVG
jgi:hypothetical protein